MGVLQIKLTKNAIAPHTHMLDVLFGSASAIFNIGASHSDFRSMYRLRHHFPGGCLVAAPERFSTAYDEPQ